MSLARAVRRGGHGALRQLHVLRQAAGGLAGAWVPPLPPPCGSPPPAAPAASPLWRYPSPLLRHLHTTAAAAAEAAAECAPAALPPYELLQQRAAAAQRGGGEAQPLLVLQPGEQAHFKRLLRSFKTSGAVRDQALALYVNSKVCGARGAA